MKNTLLLLSLVLMSIFAFGQAPQAFKYQAIARDLNGNPVINQEISVKISILAGSPEGTVVYSEIHQTTTNSLGLLNLEVGNGTVETGNFTLIAWGNNAFFIKAEIDLAGGKNFVFMGTSQLLSVPFSLYSENGMPDGQNPGGMLYWNGTQWIEVNAGLNGQVLTFSNGVPTWGGVQLPILNTSAVANITAFTAYCGGNIASDGGSPVIGRGICWNTTPNPTISDFKVIAGSGAGNFLAQMTQLEASTQYFVRAFATNSAGTNYGQEMSFYTSNGSITLTTTAISAITVNSATSGGNITLNGGSPVTARGVCWSTTQFPTIANSKTTDGSGNGVFVSELGNLAANTFYYVRAYATNSLGTSYGQQISFTTMSGIVTLTTAEVTEITATTAITGGEITNDGGSPVTARGVCWSTSQNPTIADSTTNEGSGTGSFVSSMLVLEFNTTYYVRAFATNGFGTYYGNELSFTTLEWACGDVMSYSGQNYNTVLIGTQCWFKESLNVGIMINGADEQTDNGTIEKYCYNNNPENCNIYGGLYQWDEMMQYSTIPGVRGICPGGWHLPTADEWTTLTTFLDGERVAGGKMKETGIAHWQSPNTGATNSSGFTALPSGHRHSNLNFSNLNITNNLWSSSQYSISSSWYMILSYNATNGGKDGSGKAFGFSVRCLKSETTTSQLNVTPANQDVSAITGTTTFEVISNTSWTIEESVSWLSVSPMNGSSNGTITVTYETNASAEIRIGQITIVAEGGNPIVNVTLTQAGSIQWSCGQSITDERDGKNYNTVQIGEQCWMAENLNVGNRIDGGGDQGNNTILEKYCYDNSEANCEVYGGLYQWYEMMQYDFTPGIKGICPTGWHLPTNAEWTILITFLGGEDSAGGKMKTTGTIEAGTGMWLSPNTGATNSSGFNGLPSGRYYTGNFDTKGNSANFWSSNGYSESLFLELDYNDNGADRYWQNNWFGYSVRCLID